METKKVLSWNTRASIVYAVGVWTMVGSYFFLKYTGKNDTPPDSAKLQKQLEKEDENTVVHKTVHSTTTITYKKDFVPFSTRLKNLYDYFSGKDTSGDGNCNK